MIDTASFLNSKDIAEYWHKIGYHTLMDEERVKREKEQLSCFTDEGLRLAGLK